MFKGCVLRSILLNLGLLSLSSHQIMPSKPWLRFEMDATKATMLKNLSVLEDDYMIRVRIVRLWNKPDLYKTDEVYAIEMIVVDEEGTLMQAICPNKWLPKFRSFLREKQSLIIRKPTLGDNRGKLKYVDNCNKICFQPYTTVLICKDFVGSYYGFNFASFKSVQEKSLPANVTIDVIGCIQKCYEIEDTNTRDGSVGKRMNLRIVDLEGQLLNLTLWDQYASQLNSYLIENKNEVHVVIILQFGVVKFYKDKAYLNNAYTVSRLFINSDIEEIATFKKRYVGDIEPQNTSSAPNGLGSSMLSTIHDEFVIHNDLKFIADITEINQAKYVIIVGTIKAISLDSLWYYSACDGCKFKVTSKTIAVENQQLAAKDDTYNNEVYECANANCNADPVVAVPRFRIPIRVQDHSGIVSLTMFDREAFKLLKHTAKHLLDKNNNEAPFQLYPEELNDLLERKFAFKIEVSNYNLEKKMPYYTISKLTNDTTILEDLEKKANADCPLQSESIQFGSMSGIHSQSSVCNKDSFSFTAENDTPMSVADKINGKKICEDSLPTKRNLYSIYDVDEIDVVSSKKGRPGIKIANMDEKVIPKLLIPKVEKKD